MGSQNMIMITMRSVRLVQHLELGRIYDEFYLLVLALSEL